MTLISIIGLSDYSLFYSLTELGCVCMAFLKTWSRSYLVHPTFKQGKKPVRLKYLIKVIGNFSLQED